MTRRSIAVLILTTLSVTCNAQKENTRKYSCIFTDTITYPIPDEFYRNAAADFVQSNGLPDSLVKKMAFDLKIASIMKMPMQIQTRSLDAGVDTTVVTMSAEVVHKGLEMPLPYKKMIIEKGRRILSVVSTANNELDIPSVDNRNFVTTGRSKTILGFTCNEYEADGGSISIWVTDALPAAINPGISNVNVPGAILGFKITKGYQVLSIMTSIE